MSIRDFILIGVAFAGIIAGVFLPQMAEPLEGYPRISLMLMLFLSFLGLRTQEVLRDVVRLRSRLLVMSIGKLFIAPFVTFFLFVLVMPKFALGALLLAGTPVGVISAFFALVMRADFTLALTGIVFTSLASPFTLPLLTSLALAFLGTNAEGMAHFSPLRMSLDMATLILIPYALAQAAMLRGADVTLISGKTALTPPAFVNFVPVVSASEMCSQVMDHFEATDIVIKAAAVADFKPTAVATEKIKKRDGQPVINLTPTIDILKTIGEKKRSNQFVCGFSMETENMIENTKEKLYFKNVNMMVANNLKEKGAGFNTTTNRVTIITLEKTEALPLLSKDAVAHRVLDAIQDEL